VPSINVGEVTLIFLRRQGIVFPSESSCRFGPERSVVLRRYVSGCMIGCARWKGSLRLGYLSSVKAGSLVHQESEAVVREYVRTYNCSLQRPGRAQHVARTRHAGGNRICARVAHQPAAELGR
jgi:hypothetical protein